MPLFQVKFVLQNTPFAGLGSRRLRVEPVEIETGTAKYDLLMTLSEHAEITGNLEFSTDLFDRDTAELIVADFRVILEKVVRTTAIPVEDLHALIDAGRSAREELGPPNQRRAGQDRVRQDGERG